MSGKRLFWLIVNIMSIVGYGAIHCSGQSMKLKQTGFFTLPEAYNTIDGMGMAPDGTIILSVPNFNNAYLLEKGIIQKPSPAFMAQIDPQNQVHHWYDFKQRDLHPRTGKVGPMDCEFGPDGALYVNDRQWFFDKDHQSRLLRINVRNGKAINVDVVAEGLNSCNGMYWKGDVLFVTESVLEKTDGALYSGVYAFPLKELNASKPLHIEPFHQGGSDPHLVVTFKSANALGSGADGITFDDKGNLYTTVIEEGAIYVSQLDNHHKAIRTRLFAKDKRILGPDGLIFSPNHQAFFLADFLANAIHTIDLQGTVRTLVQNGDTDGHTGELDQPAEVILRGDELLVVNMDMAWASKGYAVNTEVNPPATICLFIINPK